MGRNPTECNLALRDTTLEPRSSTHHSPTQRTVPPQNFKNRTLYHGDNLDFLRGMNDECIDLIATDPPFNTGRNRASTAGAYEDDWKWLKHGQSKPDQWSWENAVHEHWLEEVKDDNEPLFHAIEATRLSHSEGMAAFICFLSVRLLEMRRILKPTGSIYLHCDDTANGYIRMAMDAVFGRRNRRNEIVWRRYGSHNDAKRWGRIHDNILFYSKSDRYTWTGEANEPYTDEYLEESYRNQDERGYYTTAPLHARGLEGGGRDFVWRGLRDVWRFTEERLEELDGAGLIHWPKRGKIPRRKVYLDVEKGVPVRDVILDVKMAPPSEKTGSPDQKPLQLYKRIIKASSNEGDWVLDPFCGCATTPIAAEILKRNWVGIDRRTDAEAHILNRLLLTNGVATNQRFIPQDSLTKEFDAHDLAKARQLVADMNFTFTDNPPEPTNKTVDTPHLQHVSGTVVKRRNRFTYAEMKTTLVDLFGAVCWGCGYRPTPTRLHGPESFLELDHIDPVAGGGDNEITNRALLCRPCNGVKSDTKTLVALQREAGFRTGKRTRGSPPPIDLGLARMTLKDFLDRVKEREAADRVP